MPHPLEFSVLTSLCLGAMVGAVLGLTGAGGGILAVPALALGMGCSMEQATPVALIAVASSAAVGALEGLRQRLVRCRAAIVMAAAGVPLTSLGVRLAHTLSQGMLLSLFSAVMLVVAVRLLSQALRYGQAGAANSRFCVGYVDPKTGRLVWSWATGIAFALTGAVTGLMAGLLGVGGGFIMVPSLRKLTNMPMHGIVATSLMAIALVGAGGVVSIVLHGTPLPLRLTLWFSVAGAAGMLGGRVLSRRLSPRHVQVVFAAALLCVSVGLLVKVTMNASAADARSVRSSARQDPWRPSR